MTGVVLFDVDGTLVDTNYLHAVAWRRAFVEHGHDIPTAWVHHRVGMGSSLLLDELIPDGDHEAVKQSWSRHFQQLKPEIRALPGASALVREVVRRGARAVVATSSEPDDLEALLDALDVRDVLAGITDAGDVDEAKPEPEVFETAMREGGGTPERTIVVGDTVWDVEAAARAGLRCVVLGTGGIAESVLRDAGAVAFYRDPRALLDGLDDSPLAELWAPS